MAVSVEVLFFAAAREAAGCESESLMLEVDQATIEGLRSALVRHHPALERLLRHCRLAVGEEFAGSSTTIEDGAVIALIPPVSGG